MIFSEVKLTIMIEDPREVKRRLLGIEDADTPSRDDLAEALDQVNDGKIPKDRATLWMLQEEMIRWPNLEVPLHCTPTIVVVIGYILTLVERNGYHFASNLFVGDIMGFKQRICSGMQIETLRFEFTIRVMSVQNAEGQLRELLLASTPSKWQKPKQTSQKES